jgi:hypothetical protein
MQKIRDYGASVVAYFNAHRRLRMLVGTAIVLSPLLLLAGLLIKWTVNVPFWDQWDLVTLFRHYHAGTLTFNDFFAQHNEHRILLPSFLWFVLALLTHWNVSVEVMANVVCGAVGFVLLWQIIRATFTTKKMQFIVTAVVSLVFFSAVQYENWEWGFQLAWFMSNVGLLLAVWALMTWRVQAWMRLGVGVAGAVLATYSLGSGQFVWLVCLPAFWQVKDLRKLLPVWIIAAIVSVGSYYIDYHAAATANSLEVLHNPLSAGVYFLTYLARPIVPDFLASLPIALVYLTGVILVIRYLFIKRRRELTSTLLPWLCMGGFVVMVAATATVARLPLGVDQSYASRYTTISSLLLIASCVLVFRMLELYGDQLRRATKWLVWAALGVLLLLVGNNYIYGIQQMRQQHAHLMLVQQCARTARSENDDCLLLLFPNKKMAWERLQYIRSIHWGGQ